MLLLFAGTAIAIIISSSQRGKLITEMEFNEYDFSESRETFTIEQFNEPTSRTPKFMLDEKEKDP